MSSEGVIYLWEVEVEVIGAGHINTTGLELWGKSSLFEAVVDVLKELSALRVCQCSLPQPRCHESHRRSRNIGSKGLNQQCVAFKAVLMSVRYKRRSCD